MQGVHEAHVLECQVNALVPQVALTQGRWLQYLKKFGGSLAPNSFARLGTQHATRAWAQALVTVQHVSGPRALYNMHEAVDQGSLANAREAMTHSKANLGIAASGSEAKLS
eukprot:15445576-Alexandrium_andersonii.AAC.4